MKPLTHSSTFTRSISILSGCGLALLLVLLHACASDDTSTNQTGDTDLEPSSEFEDEDGDLDSESADTDEDEAEESEGELTEYRQSACIEAHPNRLRFGYVCLDDIAARNLTLVNYCSKTVNILSVEFSEDSDKDFYFGEDYGTEPIAIDKDEEFRIRILLTPKTPGTKNAFIKVKTDDETNPEIKILADNWCRMPPTELLVGPEEYDFGDVLTNEEEKVEFSLTCSSYQVDPSESCSVCTIKNIELADDEQAFWLAAPLDMPIYIMLQDSYSFGVIFKPYEERDYSTELLIEHNSDMTMSPFKIAITGSAIKACIEVDPEPPDPIDFGSVPVGETKCVDVTFFSTCSTPLIIHKVDCHYTPTNCNQDPICCIKNLTIPAGESYTTQSCYTPLGVGPDADFIEVFSNASTQHMIILIRKGEGILPGK